MGSTFLRLVVGVPSLSPAAVYRKVGHPLRASQCWVLGSPVARLSRRAQNRNSAKQRCIDAQNSRRKQSVIIMFQAFVFAFWRGSFDRKMQVATFFYFRVVFKFVLSKYLKVTYEMCHIDYCESLFGVGVPWFRVCSIVRLCQWFSMILKRSVSCKICGCVVGRV
jgi:hypothetical protein